MKTFRNLLLLLISQIIGQNQMHAQEVSVKATIDSANITIGDVIHLTLSATYNPQKYQLQFPTIQDTFNHFEVLEKMKVDTNQGRDLNTYTQQIQISNYDSGSWLIPKFNFNVTPLQGGTAYSIPTDSFIVNVNTIPVDTSKPFRPIFGIRSAAMPLQQIILYVAGAIILLALIVFLIYYFIKKQKEKNKNKPKEPEIILQPHEKALRALDALEQKNLWQQGQEKIYHTELTDLIRSYLEEQFTIDCFEKTSSEIISQIKRIKALSTSRQQLRLLFETADMVKFAKSKPTPEQHTECAEIARYVILESYKKIKPIDPILPKN